MANNNIVFMHYDLTAQDNTQFHQIINFEANNVNSYIGTINSIPSIVSDNAAALVGGNGQLIINTNSLIFTTDGVNVAVINATGLTVNSVTTSNTGATLLVGNSVTVGNDTISISINSTVMTVGNTTNSTVVNSTVIAIGNNTINTSINSTAINTNYYQLKSTPNNSIVVPAANTVKLFMENVGGTYYLRMKTPSNTVIDITNSA